MTSGPEITNDWTRSFPTLSFNMADIANGDEQSTYKAVEDAFFGILWTLQTQRKTPLVNVNILSTLGGMLLDFCHMLAFFVHSNFSLFC